MISLTRLWGYGCFSAFLLLMSCAPVGAPDRQPTRKIEKIGVQLYTVRKEMEPDFEGTLRKVAALGYDEVEFAGLYGRDPAAVRKLLTELKLDPVASHVNWAELKRDPEALIAQTKKLGARYMVIAWFPPEERDSLADWEGWIIFFNKVGKMAREQDIQFVYHNHEFEFVKIDGVRPYDMLLAKLDPDLVQMELDLYWTTLAGVDPNDVIKSNLGRFPLFHVKDMASDSEVMVDVGAGRIDFAPIFAKQKISGARHYFVEHDDSDDPFATLEASIIHLRALRY